MGVETYEYGRIGGPKLIEEDDPEFDSDFNYPN